MLATRGSCGVVMVCSAKGEVEEESFIAARRVMLPVASDVLLLIWMDFFFERYLDRHASILRMSKLPRCEKGDVACGFRCTTTDLDGLFF
jgi:hypothetical protein